MLPHTDQPANPCCGDAPSTQRSFDFEAADRERTERALIDSLTRVLVPSRGAANDSGLEDSFGGAVTGLGAEKAVLALVRHEPLGIKILCGRGLTTEDEAACRALQSSPEIGAGLMRKVIENGEPVRIGNSREEGLGLALTQRGRSPSLLCAPVPDALIGGTQAVLYFQNDGKRAFVSRDLEWLRAYAAALGQILPLGSSGQRRFPEREDEGRRTQGDRGPEIVGDSEATRRLGELLNAYLPGTLRPDAPPILVSGESGTGKELVARYLHRHSPKRSRGPFQAFNCAGLRGELAESRLFGHAKGSFTGALAHTSGLFRAADKGVLLLDEIGEMPAEGQGLLLRVLETRTVQPLGETRETPVDVQVVFATNRDLEAEVRAGRFREDLYYRMSALRVHLAPLRDPTRLEDLRALLAFYLARHERGLQKKIMGLTPSAFRALLEYPWPGNVRELNNVCLCLVTHAQPGTRIDVPHIQALRPEVVSAARNPNPEAYLDDGTVSCAEAMRAFRNRLILDRLHRHGGSASAAAASLAISEPTFYRYWGGAKR
jgi:DNA-binding NtrC family response regulator